MSKKQGVPMKKPTKKPRTWKRWAIIRNGEIDSVWGHENTANHCALLSGDTVIRVTITEERRKK